jgi:nicotinamidase-related amidase
MAVKLGFKAVLLLDAIKGINRKREDSEEAIEEMVNTGAKTAVTRDERVYSHRFTATNKKV